MKQLAIHTRHIVRIRPDRDWYILIRIFFIILAVSVLWNVWLFYRVVNEKPIGETNPTSTNTSQTVGSVHRLFDAREAERLRYVTQYRFVDPSL